MVYTLFINNSDSNARVSSIGNVSTINLNPPIILDSNKTYSARVYLLKFYIVLVIYSQV